MLTSSLIKSTEKAGGRKNSFIKRSDCIEYNTCFNRLLFNGHALSARCSKLPLKCCSCCSDRVFKSHNGSVFASMRKTLSGNLPGLVAEEEKHSTSNAGKFEARLQTNKPPFFFLKKLRECKQQKEFRQRPRTKIYNDACNSPTRLPVCCK